MATSTSSKSKGQHSITNFFGKNVRGDECQNKNEQECAPKKTKYDRNDHRSIKSSWFTDFPWLKHDASQCIFTCKLCIKCKKNNSFTRGKSANTPKRDDILKHSKSEDHVASEQASDLQSDMKRASGNAYSTVKDAIVALMRTVFVMAKEALPTCKASALINLQVQNGVSCLEKAFTNGAMYMHHDSIKDIYAALRHVVKSELEADRDLSPFPYFGLEMDEATDSANKSILLVYMRYMGADGEIKTKYVAVSELPYTGADPIYRSVKSIMAANGLFEVDHVGLASDGASVMVGVHKGVATQFKNECPWIITNHCMAHRLQLLSEKAANQVPYIVKYISILNQFAKSLKFSPKLCRLLEDCKELNGETAGKIKQVFFTRWLSFQSSVQVLTCCLGSVISCVLAAAMERGLEGRAMLQGLAKQMSCYKFVMMTYFLADVMGILGLMSRGLQKADITHIEGKSLADAAIASILCLASSPGPYTQAALNILPDSPDDSGYSPYKTHDIKDSPAEREKCKASAQAFVEDLVMRLEATFPDTSVMSHFSIFCPRDQPRPKPVEDLKALIDHFSIYVDEFETLTEWQLLSHVMQQDQYKNSDMQHFFKEYLQCNRNTFPNLSKICAIGMIVPVTSVNCERGISRYNYIKSDSRSSLSVELTDTLMVLSLESKPIEKFDFESAFQYWVSMKDRRGFNSALKNVHVDKHVDKNNPVVSGFGSDQQQDGPLDLSMC